MPAPAVSTQPTLECHGVSISVGGRPLVADLELRLAAGDWLAVLGRNGVGKTMTLESISGIRRPQSGTVTVLGRAIDSEPARSAARRMTLVTQQQNDAFATSVVDNILLGRYPHLGVWHREGADDRRMAMESLAAVGLQGFAERDITTLSGGERQRTAIAQALTQDTPLLLLDEPLSHLDPAHAVAIVRLLTERASRGYTLISSLHDVNVAAQFASHALLLYGDGRWRFGPVAETLDASSLSELYDAPMLAVTGAGRTYFVPDNG